MADPTAVFDMGPRRERLSALGVLVLVVGFAVANTVVAGLSWRSLRPEWPLDMAYFHQQVWNLAHGNGFVQSVHWHEGQSLLANGQFSPILVLAAPLQRLWPGLDSLLSLQSALIALGGYGAWRLARAHGAGPAVSLGGAAVFLLQAPLWHVAQSDVRPLVWSVPFLVLLAAALAEQRRFEVLVWALLACLCREEIPLIVAGLAILHGLGRGVPNRSRAFAFAIATSALGLLAATVLVRTHAPWNHVSSNMSLLESWSWVGTSLPGVWSPPGVGTEPGWVGRLSDRSIWLLAWGWPVGLLALGAPRLLLATVPLLGYLMTTDLNWACEGCSSYYTGPAVALVGGAAAVALGRLDGSRPTARATWTGHALGPRPNPRWLVFACLGGLLAVELAQLGAASSSWIEDRVRPTLVGDPDVRAARALAARVPADAAVMADFRTIHLFGGRRWVYCYERQSMQSDFDIGAPGPFIDAEMQPAWVLIDLRHEEWVARSERFGLVQRARAGAYVLLGPPG